MGSNRLYIANAQTTLSQTRIYGEFDDSRVQINIKLGIGWLLQTNAVEVNSNFASKTPASSWAAKCDAWFKRNIQLLNPEESLANSFLFNGSILDGTTITQAKITPPEDKSGFIAQDIQKGFPQNIQPDTEGYLQIVMAEYDLS